MARAKVGFLFGLATLTGILCLTALNRQQHASEAYAIVAAALLAAWVLDFFMLGSFLQLCRDRRARGLSVDGSVRAALKTALKWPLLMRMLETEFLTLYYAFFAKTESHDTATDTRFAYSKTSNARDVYLCVAFSQLPFVPFIHAFIEHKKGPAGAWVFTLITLWSVIWYLAQVQAVRFRPLLIEGEQLRYRFGLMWEAEIPLDNICLARHLDICEKLNSNELFLSPMGSRKTLLLEFKTPVQFSGPYFMRKRRCKAAIAVDDPSLLLGELAYRGVVIA